MENNRAMIDDHSDSEDELEIPNISITLPLWYLDPYAEPYTALSTDIENMAKTVKDDDFVRNISPLSIESKLHLGEASKKSGLVGDGAGKVQQRNYSFGDLGECGDIAKEICPMHLRAPCTFYGQGYLTKAVMMHQSLAKYTLKNINHNLDCAKVIMKGIRNNCLQDLDILCDNNFLAVFNYLFKSFAIDFERNTFPLLEFASKKIAISDLSSFYQWMLQNDAELDSDKSLFSLLPEAKHLDIKQLVDQCWYTLSESPTLGLWETSALKYYMVAREQRCEEMMILMLTRIRTLFLWIVGTKEYLMFDVKELLYILKMHTICVNSEDEIFFSVLRWMEYNWEERKQHALLLFKEVRFRQMETGLRMSLCTEQENELLTELCDMYQILKWLEDALFFNMKIKDKTRPRNRQKMLNAIAKSEERNWIYIPGVPHHHDIECPRYRPLTYETFKKFLIKVQNVGKNFMDQACYVPQKFWYQYECCHDLAGKDHKLGKPIRPKMYSSEVFEKYEYIDDDKKLTPKEMQAYYKSQTW